MTKPKKKALLWLIIPFASLTILCVALMVVGLVQKLGSLQQNPDGFGGMPYGQDAYPYQNNPGEQGQY